MSSPLFEHRIKTLEEQMVLKEARLRALEIAHARLIGWAAGGAFAGGLVFQVAQYMFK